MKAIVYEKYGSPRVLKLKEIEKPMPGDFEVLVKIKSAAVNSWDWDLLRGRPLVFRLLFGIFKPKHKILGADIAGKVESIGSKVKKFHIGDDVFGDLCEYSWGGFAEFVCAHENALTLKPAAMTFEQAAAIPQAAAMALQSIRDKGKVKDGQKVLINGAGGGVGTFAVQMAKYYGAEVTGVDSTEKLHMIKSIGADYVIDYTKEDFTKIGQRYDLIVDVVAKRSIFDYRRALRPGGIFVMVGGSVKTILQFMLVGPLISKMGNKKLGILVHKPNKDLAYLCELFKKGKLVPVIDRSFSLSATAEALVHIGQGRVKGKIVIMTEKKENQ